MSLEQIANTAHTHSQKEHQQLERQLLHLRPHQYALTRRRISLLLILTLSLSLSLKIEGARRRQNHQSRPNQSRPLESSQIK